jgi:hypothetical protein
VLFSNDRIVKLLDDSFECAWESVRPVPRVEIDFGGGKRLSRTLNGNIATYFLTPEGRVFDLLPGLVEPAELIARAQAALALHARIQAALDPARLVREHHETPAAALPAPRPAPPLPSVGDGGKPRHPLVDFAKKREEEPIKMGLEPVEPLRVELAADTASNREHRYPRARALLHRRPLARPEEITLEVYRDVLGTDLEDPFLGLAPYVLGGEGGRTIGGGPEAAARPEGPAK